MVCIIGRRFNGFVIMKTFELRWLWVCNELCMKTMELSSVDLVLLHCLNYYGFVMNYGNYGFATCILMYMHLNLNYYKMLTKSEYV
jgi:hypothetical protein